MVPAQQLVRPYPSAAAAQAVKPVRPAPGNPFYVEHKGKRSSFRPARPLQALFFFVPGAARFFFSFKRKRNVGRNILPFTREDQTRFTMRINRELLEQIKAEAEKNKRSAATEIE